MNNYVKLLNNLEELGLLNIKASIDKYIDLINSGSGSPIEYQADEKAGVAWLSWRVSGR